MTAHHYGRQQEQGQRQCGALAVAMPAIEVEGRRLGVVRPVGRRGGIGLMLVLVMPDVRSARAGFVLAIAAHRSPAELERQQDEKKDRQPATHGRECSDYALADMLQGRADVKRFTG